MSAVYSEYLACKTAPIFLCATPSISSACYSHAEKPCGMRYACKGHVFDRVVYPQPSPVCCSVAIIIIATVVGGWCSGFNAPYLLIV